jgi:chorismate mutase
LASACGGQTWLNEQLLGGLVNAPPDMLGGWECGMTSDTDDLEKQLQEKLKLRSELGNLEEQLQQNLKLRRELGAKVAKARDRNAKDRLDTDKRKLLKWAPHEYLDSVFHPRTLPIEPPKANDHPKPSEREEGPVDSPAQPIFRVSLPRLGDRSQKLAS